MALSDILAVGGSDEFRVDSSGNIVSLGTLTGTSGTLSGTLDLNAALDLDHALTGTGDLANITGTIAHATQSAEGLDVALAQLTAVRSSGIVAGIKSSVTSLAADTGGDFACLQLEATDGGGTTPTHSAIYSASAMDAFLKVSASGKAGVTVGAMTAKSPETDTEAGYISILVGSTRYEIPFYAVV